MDRSILLSSIPKYRYNFQMLAVQDTPPLHTCNLPNPKLSNPYQQPPIWPLYIVFFFLKKNANLSPIPPSLHLKAYLFPRSLLDRLNSLICTIHISFHPPCLLTPRLLYTDHSLLAPVRFGSHLHKTDSISLQQLFTSDNLSVVHTSSLRPHLVSCYSSSSPYYNDIVCDFHRGETLASSVPWH